MNHGQQYRATAGCKVILLGEHAVVYGTNGLVVGFPDAITVEAHQGNMSLRLEVPSWGYSAQVDGQEPSDRAFCALVDSLGLTDECGQLVATAHIPPRAGLGASAAIAGASAKALCELFRIPITTERLGEAVMASERIFHHTPSGIDTAAVLNSGLLTFNKEKGVMPLVSSIPPIFVVYSGEPGATSCTVKQFAEKLQQESKEAYDRIRLIDELVQGGIQAIKGNDWMTLGKLMNENQRHLNWFGVSTERLNHICAIALQEGAWGAKLTGGGGGGCAVILSDTKRAPRLQERLMSAGYRTVF